MYVMYVTWCIIYIYICVYIYSLSISNPDFYRGLPQKRQEWFCQWFQATKLGEDPCRQDLALSQEEPLGRGLKWEVYLWEMVVLYDKWLCKMEVLHGFTVKEKGLTLKTMKRLGFYLWNMLVYPWTKGFTMQNEGFTIADEDRLRFYYATWRFYYEHLVLSWPSLAFYGISCENFWGTFFQ